MTRPARLALAGAGAWGQNLLRLACASPRVALAAVVDPDERARALAAGRAPAARAFPALSAALAAVPLDAVLIASPARSHAALACEALDAGLDVFVEKPLATSAADAAALVDLAQRRGRVAMVGHLLRYHPAVRRLLDEVRRGAIGEPRQLSSSRRSPPGRPSDVSALWALGPHDVSLLLALDASPLASLSARVSPEEASLHGRTAAGLSIRLHLARNHHEKERRLVLQGREGALIFDDLRPLAPLTLHRPSGDGFSPHGEPLLTDPAEPLSREFEHFLDCVAGRLTPLTPASDGLRVVRWLEDLAPQPPQRAAQGG